jgi:hypothetical protein
MVAIEKESGLTHVNSPIYCLDESTGILEMYDEIKTASAKEVSVSVHGGLVYLAVANYEAWLDIYAITQSGRGSLIKMQSLPGVEFKKVKLLSVGKDLYLLTVSRRDQTAVQLFKFDNTVNNFVLVQTLDHNDVLDVEMTLLPTKELTVFVLVDCNTRPNLYIYTLQGATGLRMRSDLTIWAPGAQSLTAFMVEANEAYYIAYTGRLAKESTDPRRSMIHKAMFKGKKL